jgi:hypothetical protein
MPTQSRRQTATISMTESSRWHGIEFRLSDAQRADLTTFAPRGN